jgi:hypothetical protein
MDANRAARPNRAAVAVVEEVEEKDSDDERWGF